MKLIKSTALGELRGKAGVVHVFPANTLSDGDETKLGRDDILGLLMSCCGGCTWLLHVYVGIEYRGDCKSNVETVYRVMVVYEAATLDVTRPLKSDSVFHSCSPSNSSGN